MEREQHLPGADLIALAWALTCLSQSFCDLAAGYARSDRVAARRMLAAIAADLGQRMTEEKRKLVAQGFGVAAADAAMRPVAQHLHTALQAAQAAIEQVQQPH